MSLYLFFIFLLFYNCPHLYICIVCMYIWLNCIYLYLNVYCQCLMLTVCTKGLRVTQFQFSVCMYCTCGRIDNKARLDLTWNHSYMLICCSRNISYYYYQCWKQLCCLIILWNTFFILLRTKNHPKICNNTNVVLLSKQISVFLKHLQSHQPLSRCLPAWFEMLQCFSWSETTWPSVQMR